MSEPCAPELPRIIFKELKGFQAINEQGKVKTILFLNAAREVVDIIGKCSLHLRFSPFSLVLLFNCYSEAIEKKFK